MEALRSYPRAYSEWRARRAAFWIAGAGVVLGTMFACLLLSLMSGELAAAVLIIGIVLYAVAFPMVVMRLYEFRCPRCGGRYVAVVREWPGGGPFQGRCARCALPQEPPNVG
jgi:hypothetical protein